MDKIPQDLPTFIDLLKNWAMTKGIKVALIILGMWALIQFAKIVGKRIIKIAEDNDPTTENERERTTKTLVQIFNFVIRIIVIIFGGISIVKELGFDIGPILAGAGILGLAVGFGSQSLVKDIVSGFFLIMENQIRIGDVVKIAGVSGQVEKMTLRIVILRDIEGIVHAIPNGEITTVSNMTYGWSRALIDVEVAYKEDIDKVMEILKQIGDGLVHDEKFDNIITDDPIILGVDSLGESGVSIRVLFKTIPQKQWEVAREYKRRVKNEFGRLGIEIPFPHKTVYLRQEAIPAKSA